MPSKTRGRGKTQRQQGGGTTDPREIQKYARLYNISYDEAARRLKPWFSSAETPPQPRRDTRRRRGKTRGRTRGRTRGKTQRRA